MGVLEDVREQFPTLAWLLNNPEIGPLLRRAVDPSATYSPSRFQAELMQTNWWRQRSQSAREAEILFHTDRGTYDSNIRSYRAAILQRAAQLGVKLSTKEATYLATMAFQQGTDMEGPVIDMGLLQMRRKPGHIADGAVRTYARAAKQLGKGQWYVNIGDGSALRWGEYIATGQKTEQDLQNYLQQKAMSRYPWLKQQLNTGATMDDIFSEHKNIIAETLELDPNQLDLTGGKWRKVLEYFDSGTKKRRGMTTGEAEYFARQDSRFWKTKNGRQADAEAATMMLNIFGKRTI